ncbi:MAG: hypothetical protein ACM3SQ_05180 [Betaproteobacteria bacterium]
MTSAADKADYGFRRTDDKTAAGGAPAGHAAVVEFLQLLGRAARQFRTYPATSPLCTDAIDACHRAFMALDLDQPLNVRVSRREILLDVETAIRDTVIEQELCRPLHRARVAAVEIDRAVSIRDWSRFCEIMATGVRGSRATPSFPELLLDAGVSAIVLRVTPRPETLEVGAPPKAVEALVERERTRQSTLAATSAAQHLYPPDKGWVRVDPAVAFDSISLLDLTVLVNDPAELASMLTRLVDDDAGDSAARGAALEQRYSDVVMLIGALDPRLGRLLFSKLARAVLDLDSDRRRSLLRRAILPNLLDGRADGEAVLAEFPDVDLAEALCLLLDLEAAAPQLLPVAVDRLRLTPERRTAVVPLIEERFKARTESGDAADRGATADLERHAGALTRIEAGTAKSFDEFAAFDLSINDQTAATLHGVRTAILDTDDLDARLSCTARLVGVEPNPTVAGAVLARGLPALRALVLNQRWDEVRSWVAQLAGLAAGLEPSRPDVATLILETLQSFCDRDLVVRLAQLCGTAPGRTTASAIVAALGAAVVPAWFETLEDPSERPRVRALTPVVSECARQVAPAVAERLLSLGLEGRRVAVGVLGFAGPGHEALIAEQAMAEDDRLSREALRALARIGSAKAAACIVAQLEAGRAAVQPAAEEALWRLPASLALAKARELLETRRFVTRHPQAAVRLLERAAQGAAAGLAPVLASLVPLRFHFWSPAVARVGSRARDLLQ